MARGTKKQEQASEVAADFPYRALMAHPAWAIIDRALGDLESNNDVKLQTARRYFIGYMLQELIEQGQLAPAIASRPDAPNVRQPKYQWLLQVEAPVDVAHLKRGKRTAGKSWAAFRRQPA